MQLDVPFFSQLDDQIPPDLRRSVCAIACIKMILDFKGIENSFASILSESLFIGEKDKMGWTHEVLVRIFRNHGLMSYRQEFVAHSIDLNAQSAVVAEHTSHFVEKGIQKIKENIDNQKPVMVSVKSGFSENKEDHIVLIIGYAERSLIILDPIVQAENQPKTVSLEEFVNFWKRLAIFIE